jgi:hypothetical protein
VTKTKASQAFLEIIDGNVQTFYSVGLFEEFVKAQRRTWRKIRAAGVTGQVREVLRSRHRETMRQSVER